MKKRIIIVGDSFSLGVGADWPPFENVHPLAPPIGDTWIENWKRLTSDYIKDYKLQVNEGIKENTSILESMASLQRMYRAWCNKVLETDYFSLLKEEHPNLTHDEMNLDPGLKHKRQSLESYPGTWSNVLRELLTDIEVINLSQGGNSMGSVVSSLSSFLNTSKNNSQFDTLVFFQAPDPIRKQLILRDLPKWVNTDQEEYNLNLEHLLNLNVATINKITLDKHTDSTYDFTGHNLAYIENDLSIGEWYQNIYNMQQICKANNFSMAWCSAQIPITDIQSNFDNEFSNVMNLDVRFDRMPHQIDSQFESLANMHRDIGIEHVNYEDIFSGCMHFSGEVQKHFAEYMAKSLKDNKDFWWQK